jgi:hypothetical protein
MRIRKDMIWIAGLTIVWLLAFSGSSFARFEEEILEDLRYRSVRAMGMGNAFAAIADDGDAFYYNPAGMTSAGGIRVDIQPIRLMPTQDFFGEFKERNQLMDDINAISESESPLEDPELEDERRRIMDRMKRLLDEDLGLDAAAPARIIVPLHVGDYGVAVGGIIHGWSESQVNVQRRGLNWDDFVKGMLDDEVLYNVTAEMSYGGAVAVEIPITSLPLELSLGLGVRRTRRWQMTDKNDLLGIDDLINPDGKDGIEGTADDFKARYFDPDDPWDSVVESKGYNIDIGTLASFDDAINFAIVLQNLAGKIEDEKLPRDFGISASVNLAKLPTPDVPMLDVILAAGLDNTEDTQENSWVVDKTRLGLEVIWNIPLLALSGRIGSNHGHMTLGAGVQLMFLDFDYAFFGDQNTNWHAFSLSLAF